MSDNTTDREYSPWNPYVNSALDLKHLGKLAEELGELTACVSRCIIQGVNANEPITGKPNKQWLEDEIADVGANLIKVIDYFKLNQMALNARMEVKSKKLTKWHAMITEEKL